MDKQPSELKYLMCIVAIRISQLVIVRMSAKIAILANLFRKGLKGFAKHTAFYGCFDSIDKFVLCAALVV